MAGETLPVALNTPPRSTGTYSNLTPGLLPLLAVQSLGAFFGLVSLPFSSRPKRYSEVNLRVVFPRMSAGERRRLLRRSLVAQAKTVAETSSMWTWSLRRMKRCIKETVGAQYLADAVDAGGGVILAMPHLGNWELTGIYVSSLYPMTALHTPLGVREVSELAEQCRGRFGMRLVLPDPGGVRSMLKSLGAGKIVAILPDQDAGDGLGVFVPFFGVLANTMVLLPRLVQRGDARVVFCWTERLPWGRGFRLHFKPASETMYDQDLATAAAGMNKDVESAVMQCPEQYMWGYKRFRTRPPGSPGLYKVE